MSTPNSIAVAQKILFDIGWDKSDADEVAEHLVAPIIQSAIEEGIAHAVVTNSAATAGEPSESSRDLCRRLHGQSKPAATEPRKAAPPCATPVYDVGEQGAERADLLARIQSYLGNGGLFNPEMMEHEKVRDLLIDCREALSQLHGDPAEKKGCKCPKGERCGCYILGYTDAEYDHGLALDSLDSPKITTNADAYQDGTISMEHHGDSATAGQDDLDLKLQLQSAIELLGEAKDRLGDTAFPALSARIAKFINATLPPSAAKEKKIQ